MPMTNHTRGSATSPKSTGPVIVGRWSAIAALAILAVAGVSTAGQSELPKAMQKVADLTPSFGGPDRVWTGLTFNAFEDDTVEWNWTASGPVDFCVISPDGTLLARITGVASDAGFLKLKTSGEHRTLWNNPSTSRYVHIDGVVRVKPGLSAAPVVTPQGRPEGVVRDETVLIDVAVVSIAILAIEVACVIAYSMMTGLRPPRRARTRPEAYAAAYGSFGPVALPTAAGTMPEPTALMAPGVSVRRK
jgi:hypothetical protein